MWWALLSLGWAHDGPPFVDTVLWGAEGDRVISFTHGLLFEDGGWDWVCEELLGTALGTSVARTSRVLAFGTTAGVMVSEDGCDWTWNEQLAQQLTYGLQADPSDPDVLWVATLTGLWRSLDHGASFALHDSPGPTASIRSFTLAGDGTVYVLGFDGSTPTLWVRGAEGWTSSALSVTGGRLEMLGVDAQHRAYASFPLGDGSDQLLRFTPDAGVSQLLTSASHIAAFEAADDLLVASLRGVGLVQSTDDGASWTEPAGAAVECLYERAGTWTLCPGIGSLVAVQTATDPLGPYSDELAYADLAGQRCTSGSFAAEQCGPLWPVVREQLGVIAGEVVDSEPPPEASGCAGCTSGGGVGWWLLVPLFARRRAGQV